MHTTDQRQPEQPEFLNDPRVTASMNKHYLAWRSFDQGDGVWAAVETVAQKLGVCERTVQYNLRRLAALGLIKVSQRFRQGRQKANFCTFPTPDWWIQDHAEGGVQNCTLTRLVDHSADVDASEEPGSVDDPDAEVGTSPPSQSRSVLPGERRRSRWTPLGRRTLLYTHRDTWELLEFFEEQIQGRDIAEKGKARKIGYLRRDKWKKSANTLLDDHPVAECTAVITWIFDHWDGLLPFPVANDHTGRIDPTQRRVTRVAQILEHYPEILAMMNQRLEVIPDPPVVPDPPVKKPKAYYDHGEGFPMEDQVGVLVELFAKTKFRGASDFDVFGWRKTFRLMLTHHQIPYDDIVMVVSALGDKRLHLDFGRYSAPYDLVRKGPGEVVRPGEHPREWVNILDWVKIALKREQMRPTPPPSPRWPYLDDDDIPHIRRADDTGGSVNMADSVAERQRRYEERQRRYEARQEAPQQRPARSPFDDEEQWA